jgi:hypothetical protein
MPRGVVRAAGMLVGTAAAVVLATGCAGALPPVGEPIPEPEAPVMSAVDCRSEPTSAMMFDSSATPDPTIPVPGRVPAGFEASAALLCVVDRTPLNEVDTAPDVAPSTPNLRVRVERLEGDLTALLAALAEPDDLAPVDTVCTADMEIVPALWLEDADGGVVPVHYPRNVCGKTKPAVHEAIAGLEVTDVQPWTSPGR